MARRANNLVSVSVNDHNLPIRLKRFGLTLRSPQVTIEMQRGAEIMAESARRRAPVGATGLLRKGVYTASSVRNNYQQLTRRGGQKVNSPLKFPPRRGQVVIVTSTFYGRWVERGRKRRDAMYGPGFEGKSHERRAVGLQGRRKRGRPFFRPGIKAAQPTAEAFVVRRLERLITQAYERGG